MRTLLPDPPPPGFDALLEQRRRTGVDRFDEVWDGVRHVNPAPHGRLSELQQQLAEIFGPLARAVGLVPTTGGLNLGRPSDYRVPDAGLYSGPSRMYYETVALAVEILSPHDETWEKLPFYAAHAVDEVLILDPDARAVHWLGLRGSEYAPIERSGLIELGAAELGERINWPGD